ncbi:cell division ATP-binding protein FtsE [Herbiconiux moechotypicola]|uniref:Cell division ATP-binding protein FtsE n=1 Tax=Herbiconiux moechotypicola TaxID=637393 RepID=A0ABN3D872_9MICO|nr:cell division ATP-binding protein FtsE [Herbiconiux moechotypicola]MCS5728367.1 cell division ATP-binding protein FtsE [Herbiconiux moechotypicola]
MIRFDRVTKTYRGTKRPALNAIDLEILRGEFVFLVGASGSGKSSFLRLILKEDRPTSGSIHVLGQDLGAISNRKVPYFRRNLGVVFQDFRLLPGKNVFDNVAFTLQVIGKSRGFIQEAVPDVLQMVGLAEKANRLPHELSGGEQQRVAIARAVVNKPAILLADEPTGNLDPSTSAGIMTVLERINAGGTTVVMATHDNAIVDHMKRRVIELVTGQIVRDESQGGYGMTAEIALQDSGLTAEIALSEGLRPPRPEPVLVPPAPAAQTATGAVPASAAAAPAGAVPPMPVTPAHPDPLDPATESLTLAEKLGLRAPGAAGQQGDDQNVGPTT